MTKRVGHGIFAWNGTERRTDRYGAFALCRQPYAGVATADSSLNITTLRTLVGKRVHVWCKVVENRESSHVGDLFLQILPSKPDIGEIVDLGVAILDLDAGYDDLTAIEMRPGDKRKHFWIDPHKLYRLHDQTVDLFVEVTDAEFTPAPDLKSTLDAESIDNGDGTLQLKGVSDNDIERLGDGMFILSHATEKGKRRKLCKK